MSVKVALGGPSELGREWTGFLLAQLETFVPANSGFSYFPDTLNIQQEDLEDELSGSLAKSHPNWNQQNASEQAKYIGDLDGDLILLQTPDTSNDYLDTLLEPVTHMLIFTRSSNSSEFTEWKGIADDCDVETTHQVITEESSEPVYEGTDEGIIKVYTLITPSEFDPEGREWAKQRDAIERLTYDLLRLANQDA